MGDALLRLLDEFRESCEGFAGGVVYRMATHRRIVAAIAARYTAAALPQRTEAIFLLAVAAASDGHFRSSRSVVEALFAAASTLPGGAAFPIALRADLLHLLSRQRDALSSTQIERLQHLDNVIRGLFLRQSAVAVRRLGVDEPEPLLSFLERVEAVQPLSGGRAELLRRLGADCGRVAFGLFFGSMPETPLSVVYVALGGEREPPATIRAVLLGEYGSGGGTPSTACFYSITSCVDGLQGLQLGSFLIFLAMEELRQTWPSLVSFVTLSPAPVFGAWLRAHLSSGQERRPSDPESARVASDLQHFIASVAALPEDDAIGRDAACPAWLRNRLGALATKYILFERRRGGARSKCIDSVGNFHLANGALVDRVLCCADTSSRGLAASFGVMINYRYDADLLSGRAPAWRYAAQGVLCSYRSANLLRPLVGASSGYVPDVFAGLNLDAVFDAFVSAPVVARVCVPGEMVAISSDPDSFGFHVVIEGCIEVLIDDERQLGGSRVVCTVGAGQALAAAPESPATQLGFVARARLACCLIVVPLETVVLLRATHPEAAKELRRRALPEAGTGSVPSVLATPESPTPFGPPLSARTATRLSVAPKL